MRILISLQQGALLAIASLSLVACNSFLDENPRSDLVELDTPEKIRALLPAAYSTKSPTYLLELASDNVQDDGLDHPYGNQFSVGAAYWKKILNSDGYYDSPYQIWEGNYNAILHANTALRALDQLSDQESDLVKACRGEALLARAWAHFQLVSVFSLAYDPTTADKDLGIPYLLEPVTRLQPDYPRGTVAEIYAKIEADLTAGIPLVESYVVYPEEKKKFHFSAPAAYAFAARFYLYYQKWDKAIEYADKVLGGNAATMIRDWKSFTTTPRTDAAYALHYYDLTNKANLMAILRQTNYVGQTTGGTTYSNTRLTQSQYLTRIETLFAKNIWGRQDAYWFQPFIYTEKNINKTVQPKLPSFPSDSYKSFEIPFTTDETLMVRAEAKIHKGSAHYESALADLNVWTSAYLNDMDGSTARQKTFTLAEVVKHYNALPYDSESRGSLRKSFQPHFTIASEEENALLQHLLQCRRILTLHEGLRWQDVKRYGITVYRRVNNNGTYSVQDQLPGRDPRQAIALPDQSVTLSIRPNPTK